MNLRTYSLYVCSLLIIYIIHPIIKRRPVSLCSGSGACAVYGHMTTWCAHQRAVLRTEF